MNEINFSVLLPLIVVSILIISLVVSIKIHISELKHSRFYTFIQIAGPISVLFISFNMFIDGLNIELTKKQQKFNLYQTAIDKLYINLEKDIVSMYTNGRIQTIRPEVYASLYSSNLELYELTKDTKTPQTTQSIAGEKYIYIRLIQAFEDYLQYQKTWDMSDPTWLAVFIQWGKSQYLQKHFAQYKSNYNQTTISFTELIFEYSRDIQVPNTDHEIYIRQGAKLYTDERLINIQELVKPD